LQKLFPQPGEAVPRLRFNGFRDDWKEFRISEIFKVTRGNVLAKTKISSIKSNTNCYPVYSSQTANNGLLGYYNEFLYEDAITWTTDGANAGTVKFRNGRFYSTNVNGVLISNEGYANSAVSNALNNIAFKYVSHVGNPKLMNNVMADIKIKLPSLTEQKKISCLFDTLDKQIEMNSQKLDELKQLKKAYLQKMFM
jgi:type I restriction enzyme, S subunit